MRAEIKKPARQDRLFAHNIGSSCHQAQERLSPKALVEIFGPDITEVVENNLLLACDKWQQQHNWIAQVDRIIPNLPKTDNEITLRGLYEHMLPRAKRELIGVERHIRHLQQCHDLLHSTNNFSAKTPASFINIQELKDRIDIIYVVNRDVELRPAGKTHKGHCPFHEDRNPSFIVYPDQQRWWCFACNDGGDVIAFIQKLRNCSFKEAIAELQTL